MKTVFKLVVAFLAVAILLSSCYYDEVVGFVGLPVNVSFKNDVDPILAKNCATAGCHDAAETHSPSLVSDRAYDELMEGNYVNTVEPEKSKLYVELNSGMPPAGPLPVNDMKIILAWITEGAKNN